MEALRIICSILAMALLTSSAPHDSHEDGESGEYSHEDTIDPFTRSVCPEGNLTCEQKLKMCMDELQPKTADQKAYDKTWKDTVELCMEKYPDLVDGPIDLETESPWDYCQEYSLEKMNVTVNGAINREEVRIALKSRFESATPEVQTAVFDAIDKCDYVDKPFFTSYFPCILKNCTAAM